MNKFYKLPCRTCGGRGHHIWNYDIVTCPSCLGDGEIEASQSEYERFYEYINGGLEDEK